MAKCTYRLSDIVSVLSLNTRFGVDGASPISSIRNPSTVSDLEMSDSKTTAIVWFRRDLRLHDNEVLTTAIQNHQRVIAVYCFDPDEFGKTRFGFDKTGSHRTQFLRESVQDLRESIRRLGGELLVRHDQPVAVLTALVRLCDASHVYHQRLVGTEEARSEGRVQAAMRSEGVSVTSIANHTLLHQDDLPFDLEELPNLFTAFRKVVEKHWRVRKAFEVPQSLDRLALNRRPDADAVDPGEIPELAALSGASGPDVDSRATMRFAGGETEGLRRLEDYFWEHDRLRVYKETRNGMLSPLDSSRLSAWLALGCISPRYVSESVSDYELERVANDSTYWLIFELLWRDYFSFVTDKHGSKVFKRSGIQRLDLPWVEDPLLFEAWRDGRTGYPLVDANMQELAATGYMSNRGRQNVASFLTKNLGLDWRMGAEWFESQLIDYDPASNYGNWNYVAGVGNDARGFRFFNITKQSGDYDRGGDYVRHWLPQLRDVPDELVHQPWKHPGAVYPQPIVDLFESAQQNERRYDKAVGIKPKKPKVRKSKSRS